MPDVLLFANDKEVCFKLENFFKENNFRIKFTFDEALVAEWLNTLPFDLLLLPAEIPFESQKKLAFSLWEKNPQAYVLLYDPKETMEANRKKIRLLGANLAIGSRYQEVIERTAFKILGCKYLKKDEFKVLVVEDLDAARDIICTYIEGLGYPSVMGVSSAEEALGILKDKEKEIDCIITDERMPKITGHELISTLRADPQNAKLPIVVLTAHGTHDCLTESLKAGASGFLVKPPVKNDLMREMARAMRVKIGLERARLVEEHQAEELADLLS